MINGDRQVSWDTKACRLVAFKRSRRYSFHLVKSLPFIWNFEPVNSLRPRLNRRPLADDIFKCIFLNENEWILPRISLKFLPKVRINNIPALVQIMAWRRPGDKPLSEPMMVSLLTHICVTRPQWVNAFLWHPILIWIPATIWYNIMRNVLLLSAANGFSVKLGCNVFTL